MTSSLDNLVKIGQLKKEPPERAEYRGILEADDRLLAGLIDIGGRLLAAVERLAPPKK